MLQVVCEEMLEVEKKGKCFWLAHRERTFEWDVLQKFRDIQFGEHSLVCCNFSYPSTEHMPWKRGREGASGWGCYRTESVTVKTICECAYVASWSWMERVTRHEREEEKLNQPLKMKGADWCDPWLKDVEGNWTTHPLNGSLLHSPLLVYMWSFPLEWCPYQYSWNYSRG